MKAAIFVLVLGFAGFGVWQKLYSNAARIERVCHACMMESTAAGDRMTVARAQRATAHSDDDATAATTRSMGEIMQGLVQGVSAARCGATRGACTTDFDGSVCRAAVERYS